MGLIIRDVCKEKKIPLAEVAKCMGINPVTLSQSLNGNPTIATLEKVASALGVDISELFEASTKKELHGCIYVDGKPNLVNSKRDIEDLLNTL